MQKNRQDPMIGFREKLRTDARTHEGQSIGPTSYVGGSKNGEFYNNWINSQFGGYGSTLRHIGGTMRLEGAAWCQNVHIAVFEQSEIFVSPPIPA